VNNLDVTGLTVDGILEDFDVAPMATAKMLAAEMERLRAEVSSLRAALAAAEKRARKAEAERDEARELLALARQDADRRGEVATVNEDRAHTAEAALREARARIHDLCVAGDAIRDPMAPASVWDSAKARALAASPAAATPPETKPPAKPDPGGGQP
jgi:hypothetical protein